MSRPSGLRKFVGPPGLPARCPGCAVPRSARAGPPRSPGPRPIRFRPLSDRPRPRGTTPRNTASSAPPAYRPSTGTWRTWSSPASPAPAGPATSCSPHPKPGEGRIPVRPGPVPAGFVPADVRHGVGRAADPGRAGVLPEQLGARPGRLLPEPGRRHRMHPGPGRVGAPGGRVSAAGRGGTRRGGRAAVPGQPRVRGGVLHRAHRRVLRAGRPDADAVERLRRRQRGPGQHR